MRYLFLLNPAAGKQDCTVQLIPQIRAAAAQAGWSKADYTIHTTEYAGHARELARAAAQEAAPAAATTSCAPTAPGRSSPTSMPSWRAGK